MTHTNRDLRIPVTVMAIAMGTELDIPEMGSGYAPCACRDCMEVAIVTHGKMHMARLLLEELSWTDSIRALHGTMTAMGGDAKMVSANIEAVREYAHELFRSGLCNACEDECGPGNSTSEECQVMPCEEED